MNLIVGLGNIGNEYIKTRHNVGFLFLDYLRYKLNLEPEFTENSKLNSYVVKSAKLILLKPCTLMNNSGFAVNKAKNYYSIPLENVLVVQDDIDQKLGKYKTSFKGGSGGHRGIESIKVSLNTEYFTRVKIGIAPEIYNPQIHKAEDFVLKKFTSKELVILESVFEKIYKELFSN